MAHVAAVVVGRARLDGEDADADVALHTARAGDEVDGERPEAAGEMAHAVIVGDVDRRRDRVVDLPDELHVVAFVRDVEVDEHAAHVAVDAPARDAQAARRLARHRMRALVLDLVRLPREVERQARHHFAVDDDCRRRRRATGDQEECERSRRWHPHHILV